MCKVGGRRGVGLIMQPTGNKTHRELLERKKNKIKQISQEGVAVVLALQVLKRMLQRGVGDLLIHHDDLFNRI